MMLKMGSGQMTDNFYIYLHRKKSDNTIFYVGKGNRRRAYRTTNRNTYWNNVVSKHGLKVEILFSGLSNEEALQVEKDVIAELKYFGEALTNLTDGGEGCAGKVHSEETKRKMSLAALGRVNSEEAKKKMSQSRKGRKLSKTHVINSAKAHQKKVCCVTTGQVFDSIKGAANVLGLHSQSITACCKGTLKTTGGLQFKYYAEVHNG